MKISKLDLAIYALFFALFKIFIIPTAMQQGLKVISIAFILIFLLNRISKKELFNFSFWWAIIIVCTSFWGYIRNTIGLSNCINSILHGMCIYCTYTLMMYCSQKRYMEKVKKHLYFILLFYCIASLITIVLFGSGAGTSVYYFAGNKFRTSYYFIFFLSMLQVQYHSKIRKSLIYKIYFVILIVFVAALAKYIQCTTGMIAAVSVAILTFLPTKVKNVLKNPTVVVLSLGVAAVLLLVTDFISENPYIRYVITDLLGKDIGLTGRFRIYSYLFGVIKKSFLLGYGYGNYAVGTVVGYGNAQNSVMQLIVDYGVVGLCGFLILMIHCFKKSAKTDNMWGHYLYVYTMIICSMVEICFSYNFYTAIFLICWDYRDEKMTITQKTPHLLEDKSKGI